MKTASLQCSTAQLNISVPVGTCWTGIEKDSVAAMAPGLVAHHSADVSIIVNSTMEKQ